MHRLWIVAGFALVAAVGAGLSVGHTHAQPPAGDKDAGPRKVTVTGYATVAVRPDTARVSFVVKGSASDAKVAAAECDKKGAFVEKVLKDLKVGGLEVKKGPLSLTTVNGRFGPGMPGAGMPGPGGVGGPPGFPGGPGGGPLGFPGLDSVEASRTYSVTAALGKDGAAGELTDLVPVADRVLAAVIGTGATEPAGGAYDVLGRPASVPIRPEFSRANLSALRQDVLKAAVADALASARAATGVADLTLKNVVTITDQSQLGAAGGRGDVTGEAELTARVVVTFSY